MPVKAAPKEKTIEDYFNMVNSPKKRQDQNRDEAEENLVKLPPPTKKAKPLFQPPAAMSPIHSVPSREQPFADAQNEEDDDPWRPRKPDYSLYRPSISGKTSLSGLPRQIPTRPLKENKAKKGKNRRNYDEDDDFEDDVDGTDENRGKFKQKPK